VKLEPSEIQVGITHAPFEADYTWIIKVELTPSGILEVPGIRTQSYTGDITHKPLDDKIIEVSTKLGVLQVGERYSHHGSREFGNKITHSVQHASITGSITTVQGQNLASVTTSLIEEIKSICIVLSLCYRQPIRFYEIEFFTDPNSTARPEMLEATIRRRQNSLESKNTKDELIARDNLIDGGLDELVKNYNASGHKEEITRAIRFLSASYNAEVLESAYFLAYSALDLISSVGAVSDVYLLDPPKWKRVQRLLRTYLDSIATIEGIISVVEQLKAKLPELRRTSGDKRVIEACRKLNIKTDDIWRKDGFELGLKSATGMRNRLFHAASTGDTGDLFVNLIRIRALVERLILGALGWPTDRTWVWRDQQLARIKDL
jgi:hypothetical protein